MKHQLPEEKKKNDKKNITGDPLGNDLITLKLQLCDSITGLFYLDTETIHVSKPICPWATPACEGKSM